jgi:ATP-dependent DNA helicase RecG
VLSKIHISVGTRKESNQAPVAYEIPRPVVAEAIVNAIAHREYNSKGSVEVWLFQDRLEVKNPGQLPRELNAKKLEADHGSYPYNPRLAEVLYQSGYIEQFGTGMGEIFGLTAKAGLKKPVFDLNEGVKIIIYRPGNRPRYHT